MSNKNDITGDIIKTKTSSDAYRDGWDRIFKKDGNDADTKKHSTNNPQEPDVASTEQTKTK